jgi:capsular polysaccharide biosynthesis protein
MHSSDSLRTPQHLLQVGKYLLPVGTNSQWLGRTKPPREQVAVAQLAADHPESVSLYTLGKAEVLSEFAYNCYSDGECESHKLPAKFVAPAYVAELQNGMSYGRHCCVIGPAGKAIRETGFHLDGKVKAGNVRVNLLRLQYWRKRWEGDVTAHPWLPPKQRIDGRVAVLNKQFSHNFYHWLTEVLPRLATLRRAGVSADYYLVECLTVFQQNVLAALGIERHQLIQPHCRLLLEAEQLLVPSFPTPACLREFRSLLSARLGVNERGGFSRRIYISRRKTGTRTIANETDLELLLRMHRFETHSMEEYPLAKQAQLIHEAETIVAVHGAGLANLLFARPGTQVIEIVPAGRYNATCYPEKSRVFGLLHQQVFAERAQRGRELQVALDDVATALSQAERPAYRAAAA